MTIEIGLKGTKANGLVQKRMEEMKKEMDNNILDLMRNTIKKGKMERGITEEASDLKGILNGVQSQELFQNVVQIEVD